jgi:hypothetical protein
VSPHPPLEIIAWDVPAETMVTSAAFIVLAIIIVLIVAWPWNNDRK